MALVTLACARPGLERVFRKHERWSGRPESMSGCSAAGQPGGLCHNMGAARAQYQAKIEAIVDQAQRPGNNSEGAWFCTL